MRDRRRHFRLPRGLQWRLTAWVAAVLLIASTVVFAVVYSETGVQLRQQIDREVTDDSGQLAQALQAEGPVTAAAVTTAARAYLARQPYTAVSRVLFAVAPGQPAASNHPEALTAERPERGENAVDQVQENLLGRRLLAARPGFSVHQLPDVGAVRVYIRHISLSGVTVTVGAGVPLLIVAQAQHSIAVTLLLAGAAVIVLALIASYLAGARVSAPLREMAAVATRVDAGDLAPRMHANPTQSREVEVMAEAFNRMLDRLDEAFTGQRAFVADASHELRTPLTVIRGQLEVLAAEAHPSAADVRRVEALVGVEISRISRLVDDLLVLARAEHTDFLRPEPIELDGYVMDLWDGLSRTAERDFVLGAVPAGTLHADPDRVAQAIGNLVRNAIAHTAPGTGTVGLDVEVAASTVRFAITDDGPGIPVEERERVFERFYRTDGARTRAAGGAGLGLAIVRAIAEAHGGRVRAFSSARGGARLELELPGFVPSRSRAPERRYAAPR